MDLVKGQASFNESSIIFPMRVTCLCRKSCTDLQRPKTTTITIKLIKFGYNKGLL